MSVIRPIVVDEDGVVQLLDQRLLPFEESYVRCETTEAVAAAIQAMVVRGAPAIGVAAAAGLARGAQTLSADAAEFAVGFEALCVVMSESRPTAVNLFWAIARMKGVAGRSYANGAARVAALDAEARAIFAEDIAINRAIGQHGNALVASGAGVLTHCNTGSLATAGYGTALGVIRAASESGKGIHVFADETRPYLQGSRLTVWECQREGIDVTLLPDSAAGHLIASGAVDLAVVGADRIAANGDAANKIGTYQVATMCHRHKIPFYVAAPLSTIDRALADGSGIPIEQRSASEVTEVFGTPVAPADVAVFNPAFDVTPAELITAIITEHGVLRPPFAPAIAAAFAAKESSNRADA